MPHLINDTLLSLSTLVYSMIEHWQFQSRPVFKYDRYIKSYLLW